MNLLVGGFVYGAGILVAGLDDALESMWGTPENAPIDYTALVDYASMGLQYLGIAIVGYAGLSIVYSVVSAGWKRRKKQKEREQWEQQHEQRRQELQDGDIPPSELAPGQQRPQRERRPQQPRDDR